MRILMVEDAEDVAEAVASCFRREGHAVDVCAALGPARAALEVQSYDLVILDLNLPDGSGVTLLREMLDRRVPSPVLVLTARETVDERVEALDAGADDYVIKPFSLREIEARARALLRRARDPAPPVVRFGELEVDPAQAAARCRGQDLQLSKREFRLLEVFVAAKGRVCEKSFLMERLFDFDESPSQNTVEVYVARLRRRLEGTGVGIQTLRGFGYRIEHDEPDDLD
jgi:two-component system response regulator TctD